MRAGYLNDMKNYSVGILAKYTKMLFIKQRKYGSSFTAHVFFFLSFSVRSSGTLSQYSATEQENK